MQTEVRTHSALKIVSPMSRADQLEADFALMKDYLQMCVRKEDWHGVMDASADIREIVAKLGVIRETSGNQLKN